VLLPAQQQVLALPVLLVLAWQAWVGRLILVAAYGLGRNSKQAARSYWQHATALRKLGLHHFPLLQHRHGSNVVGSLYRLSRTRLFVMPTKLVILTKLVYQLVLFDLFQPANVCLMQAPAKLDCGRALPQGCK
jgi:hypothetical protein